MASHCYLACHSLCSCTLCQSTLCSCVYTSVDRCLPACDFTVKLWQLQPADSRLCLLLLVRLSRTKPPSSSQKYMRGGTGEQRLAATRLQVGSYGPDGTTLITELDVGVTRSRTGGQTQVCRCGWCTFKHASPYASPLSAIDWLPPKCSPQTNCAERCNSSILRIVHQPWKKEHTDNLCRMPCNAAGCYLCTAPMCTVTAGCCMQLIIDYSKRQLCILTKMRGKHLLVHNFRCALARCFQSMTHTSHLGAPAATYQLAITATPRAGNCRACPPQPLRPQTHSMATRVSVFKATLLAGHLNPTSDTLYYHYACMLLAFAGTYSAGCPSIVNSGL